MDARARRRTRPARRRTGGRERRAAISASSSTRVPRAVLTSTAPCGSSADGPIVHQVMGLRTARAVERQEVATRQQDSKRIMVDCAFRLLGRQRPAVVIVDGHVRNRARVGRSPARSAPCRRCPGRDRAAPGPAARPSSGRSQRRSRSSICDSQARRAAPSRQSIATSAVASVSTSGVLVATMPRRRSAGEIEMLVADRERGDDPQPVRQPLDQRRRPALGRRR